jgi:hypothetical protein
MSLSKLFLPVSAALFMSQFSALAQPTATTDPVGFQSGLSLFKLSIGADSKISDLSLSSLLRVHYGIFDYASGSFTPYWPEFYNSPPFVTAEDPYQVTYGGSGILAFTVHRYHPVIWQKPEGSSELLSWYDPPSGTQKLGLEFSYIENSEEFKAVIVFSSDSTNFIDAVNDYAAIGSMAPDLSNDGVSIALVPEPSTYALLLMSAAGALWWARTRR